MDFNPPSAIDLIKFKHGTSYITDGICGNLSEAAAVCLNHAENRDEINLRVNGTNVSVRSMPVDRRMVASHADLQDATESGAVAIAICLIRSGTKYDIVQRSRKGTGFDYYLNTKDASPDPLEHAACLEVSGILSEAPSTMKQRVRKKHEQVQRGKKGLPGYVVVVGFKTPSAIVESFS